MTWILITGATSGIGKRAAFRLASAGARVIATGRDPEKIAALEAWARSMGLKMETSRLDVRDPESIASTAAFVDGLTTGYGVDVLVNNAGYGQMMPVVQGDHAQAERMFDTNLFGAARVVRAFLPGMRARGRGRVINVSSVLGRLVTPLAGVYAGTKHALVAMNDALRLEVAGFGVQVILLEPGAVDTGFNDVAFGPLDALADDPDWGPASRRLSRIESMYRKTAADPEVIALCIERLALAPDPPPRVTAPTIARAQFETMRRLPRGVREGAFRWAMGLGHARPGRGEGKRDVTPEPRALVTGAAGGIGRATCIALAKAGYRVVATDISRDGLAALASHAEEQRLLIETRPMDVTDELSVAQVAAETEIDLLVNNAGYAEIGPIELATDSAWRDQFAVNVFGALRVTRAFAPGMIRRRRGTIVNISSVVGRVTFPFLGVYGASKHALEAITDALRMELAGFGIEVCAVQPAFIRTGFTERAKQSLGRYEMDDGPYASAVRRMDQVLDRLDRLGGEPTDVARAVARAAKSASPRARYQTPLSAWVAVRTVPWLPPQLTDRGMARFMG